MVQAPGVIDAPAHDREAGADAVENTAGENTAGENTVGDDPVGDESHPPRSGADTERADGYDRLERWVGLAIVATCCVFVFVQLAPELLFRNTTVTGGDTGAHVWFPHFLIDNFLPWRVAGWSNDFYAGFPAGQFYFPFPAVAISRMACFRLSLTRS